KPPGPGVPPPPAAARVRGAPACGGGAQSSSPTGPQRCARHPTNPQSTREHSAPPPVTAPQQKEDAMPVHRALAPICAALLAGAQPLPAAADPLPADTTYRPLPVMPPSRARAIDEAQKPAVMARQRELLDSRYDLADRPLPGAMMSGGTKPVQEGVRVRLPEGQDWDSLAAMTPAEIRDGDLLPQGFLPLPHVK